MTEKRTISVFLASPGDLAVERRAFRDCILELNLGFGDGAEIEFEPLGWEDLLASTGRRNQEIINSEIDRCDIFILVMHRRWGQDAPDAKPYSSYTEEEFHRALNRWKKEGRPEIFVFFMYVDAPSMADPGPQLSKVLDFRKQLERTQQVLYHELADKTEFTTEVDRHLRGYVKGQLPKPDARRDVIVLPVEAIREVTIAKKEATQQRQHAENDKQRADAARADELALLLAEQAASAALESRVEEARQIFAKATDGTTNLMVLYLAWEFYNRTGDLISAEQMCQRRLAICGPDAVTTDAARAYGNLGVIYQIRGEVNQAEKMHKKAMVIDKILSNQEGIARHSGNLGVTYQIRGDMKRAEEMYQKAITIDKIFGNQEGIARHLGNLGTIFETQGDLERAKKMHQMSLDIYEKLGNQEGMANAYGNLGIIFLKRGELNSAEAMHKKALSIDKKLGRQEGMAAVYSNLGSVASFRSDFAKTRELWTKAHELYVKIGMSSHVKRIQSWLDGLVMKNSVE